MKITASAVKELRAKTGAGMMECKNALVEAEGDLQRAAELLRIKGIAKADKKAGRVAAEGLIVVAISDDGKRGGMIEINCETDFVARNEQFIEFGDAVAALVVETGITDIDRLSEQPLGESTVDEARRNMVSSIGENISVRRASLLNVEGNGFISSYVHAGGTIGVLAAIGTDAANEGDAAAIGADIAMHIAAFSPTAVDEASLDPAMVETERNILIEEAMASGKPREIVEKMITGRLNKWKKEITLLDQEFVRDSDMNVAAAIKAAAEKAGSAITVQGFDRIVRGEGIEKQESNLADEVAATLK